jgi:hypothetical protein
VRVVVVEVVVVVVWGVAVMVARAAEAAVRRPRAVARFALCPERAAVRTAYHGIRSLGIADSAPFFFFLHIDAVFALLRASSHPSRGPPYPPGTTEAAPTSGRICQPGPGSSPNGVYVSKGNLDQSGNWPNGIEPERQLAE